MTNLAKAPLGLEWRGGNSIIAYCQDKEALKQILSEGLYQALSLYSKDTPESNIKVMMADLLETYQYEPVSVIIDTIKDIRVGKRKIYGMVTPNDINELLTAKLELLSIERETIHYNNKGFDSQSITERTSGRLSDFFEGK